MLFVYSQLMDIQLKKIIKGLGYLLGMALFGAAVGIVSVIVKTIIKYYWGTL